MPHVATSKRGGIERMVMMFREEKNILEKEIVELDKTLMGPMR